VHLVYIPFKRPVAQWTESMCLVLLVVFSILKFKQTVFEAYGLAYDANDTTDSWLVGIETVGLLLPMLVGLYGIVGAGFFHFHSCH
jgi:hypothetical protein